LHEASQTVNDIFDYLFAHSWQLLSEDARLVLMAMTLFAESTSKEALGATAGLAGFNLDKALAQLVEMSLLTVDEILSGTQIRYSAHPLTRSFAADKLTEWSEYETMARTRCIDFFLQFASAVALHDSVVMTHRRYK